MPEPTIQAVALVLGAAQLQVDRYRVWGHEAQATALEQAMGSVSARLSGPTPVVADRFTPMVGAPIIGAPGCPACLTGTGAHCAGCHPDTSAPSAQPARGRGDAHGPDHG